MSYHHLVICNVLFYRMSIVLIYFFLQAEDGIRYWSVTGVQTCALPISRKVHFRRGKTRETPSWHRRLRVPRPGLRPEIAVPRSEERRVGKESRSVWAPDR